jgi:hypothetical protein
LGLIRQPHHDEALPLVHHGDRYLTLPHHEHSVYVSTPSRFGIHSDLQVLCVDPPLVERKPLFDKILIANRYCACPCKADDVKKSARC